MPVDDQSELPSTGSQLSGDPGMLPDLGYVVAIENFSGPLDLLLFLVRRTELDIIDIPIVTIVDQFIDTIRLWRDLDLDTAGDFILMAATLLEIKARAIAPPPEGDAAAGAADDDIIDPRSNLISSLLRYRRFKEASRVLEVLEAERAPCIERQLHEAIPEEALDESSLDLTAVDAHQLLRTCEAIFSRLDGLGPRTVVADDQPMSWRIDQLIDALRQQESRSLADIIGIRPTRLATVGTVLAVLECTRQRLVAVHQERQYGSIEVRLRDANAHTEPQGESASEPEQIGPRQRRRLPLITFQAPAGASDPTDIPLTEEVHESDEQRFLRELEQACQVDSLLSRTADLDAGFAAYCQLHHPDLVPQSVPPVIPSPIAPAEDGAPPTGEAIPPSGDAPAVAAALLVPAQEASGGTGEAAYAIDSSRPEPQAECTAASLVVPAADAAGSQATPPAPDEQVAGRFAAALDANIESASATISDAAPAGIGAIEPVIAAAGLVCSASAETPTPDPARAIAGHAVQPLLARNDENLPDSAVQPRPADQERAWPVDLTVPPVIAREAQVEPTRAAFCAPADTPSPPNPSTTAPAAGLSTLIDAREGDGTGAGRDDGDAHATRDAEPGWERASGCEQPESDLGVMDGDARATGSPDAAPPPPANAGPSALAAPPAADAIRTATAPDESPVPLPAALDVTPPMPPAAWSQAADPSPPAAEHRIAMPPAPPEADPAFETDPLAPAADLPSPLGTGPRAQASATDMATLRDQPASHVAAVTAAAIEAIPASAGHPGQLDVTPEEAAHAATTAPVAEQVTTGLHDEPSIPVMGVADALMTADAVPLASAPAAEHEGPAADLPAPAPEPAACARPLGTGEAGPALPPPELLVAAMACAGVRIVAPVAEPLAAAPALTVGPPQEAAAQADQVRIALAQVPGEGGEAVARTAPPPAHGGRPGPDPGPPPPPTPGVPPPPDDRPTDLPYPRPATPRSSRSPRPAPPTHFPSLPTMSPSSTRTRLLIAALVAVNMAWLAYAWLSFLPTHVLEPVATPGPAVQGHAALCFAFNLDLVDDDALKAAPAAVPILTPPVTGRWSWRDRRTLQFAPSSDLPLATAIHVHLGKDDLRSSSGFRLANDLDLELRTPALDILEARVETYAPDGQAIIVLDFNQAVDQQQIARQLAVSDGDEHENHPHATIAVTALDNAPSARVRLSIASSDHHELGPAQLGLPQGTSGIAGLLGLASAWSTHLDLGHVLAVQGISALAPAHGDVTLHLETGSAAIPLTLLAEAITITPAVAYTVHPDGHGLALAGAFVPGQEYRIDIAERWPEAAPQHPLAAYPGAGTLSITIPDRQPGVWLDETALRDGHVQLAAQEIDQATVEVIGADADQPLVSQEVLFSEGEEFDSFGATLDADELFGLLPSGSYRLRIRSGDGPMPLLETTLVIQELPVRPAALATALVRWCAAGIDAHGSADVKVRIHHLSE